MAVVEQYLRNWATEAKVANHANRLYDAAGVLTEWRASFFVLIRTPEPSLLASATKVISA